MSRLWELQLLQLLQMGLQRPHPGKPQLDQQGAAMIGMWLLTLTLPTLPTSRSTNTAQGWTLGLAVVVLTVGTQYVSATVNKELECN